MGKTIAIAGKGGVGKTTITGFLIKYLIKKNKGAILAVDADANSNLNEVLGVEAGQSLGEIREEMSIAEANKSPIPGGMTKQEYANFKMGEALSEEDDFDLLVMGRSQGKGCYCFVNGLLQAEIQKYASNYEYIVVDNEAGMEHISRGLLPAIDTIILVSDCSRRGIQAVGRIQELVKELGIEPKQVKLIVNRAPNGELREGVAEEIKLQNLDLAGVLPHDDKIYEYDSEGMATSALPEDEPMHKKLIEILDSLDI